MKFSIALLLLLNCFAFSQAKSFIAAPGSPLSKVVALLKSMQDELQADAEKDEEVYEKFSCWCHDNDREKTQAIANAEQNIKALTGKIEENTGLIAQLKEEVKNLDQEIKQNQQALATATAQRKKQLAEFNAEDKDLTQSISALASAITVLSKHHGNTALISEALARVHQRVKHLPEHIHKVTKAQSLLQYAPQSGEIFGILQDMHETFEANLAAAKKEEAQNQAEFEQLRAAKEEQIKNGSDQKLAKEQEKADATEKKGQQIEERKNTSESLSADEKFLRELTEKCKQTDDEWEARQKTRQDEILAVSQAISILSADDSRDTFSRTLNFLQENSSVENKRKQVLKILSKYASNPRLFALSSRVKLDAFDKVKYMIDDMIEELKKEKADEIAHKDWCHEEFNSNDSDTNEATRKKNDSEAKIEDHQQQIITFEKKIKETKAAIAELQLNVKRAGEDRELENIEFQKTVNDQMATQKTIQKAIDVLGHFYDKKQQGTGFAQQPAGFEKYEAKGGSGVLGMLNNIKADTFALETEARRDEATSQRRYEELVADMTAALKANNKDLVQLNSSNAAEKRELNSEEKNLAQITSELKSLADENTNLHKSCDFVLENFEIRQTARDQEVEALRQAKAILSGSNAKAFLSK